VSARKLDGERRRFPEADGTDGRGHATDGASLFHANAQVYSLLGAAAAGAAVVIYERFSSSRWWEWCRAHDITEFNAMGSMLKMLDNRPESSDDADNPVERVFSAGTPPELIESFEERFGLRVVEGYSLTEDPLLVLNPVDEGKRRIGSIGLPPAEKRIRIVDEDGTDVPRGERGEIVQRCPAVMAGYHRQPEKTDEAIVDGWFYTGDYGKIDEDGFVYFLETGRRTSSDEGREHLLIRGRGRH